MHFFHQARKPLRGFGKVEVLIGIDFLVDGQHSPVNERTFPVFSLFAVYNRQLIQRRRIARVSRARVCFLNLDRSFQQRFGICVVLCPLWIMARTYRHWNTESGLAFLSCSRTLSAHLASGSASASRS